MKCNDCGTLNYEPSSRADVCISCFDLRGQLIGGVKSGIVSMDEFRELQRVISAGRGQAANAIRRALGVTAPEI